MNPHDRVPLWIALESDDRAALDAAVRYACPVAISQALTRRTEPLSIEAALAVLNDQGNRHATRRRVGHLVRLDEAALDRLFASSRDTIRYVVERNDLTTGLLHHLVRCSFACETYVMREVLARAVLHPACTEETLTAIWEHSESARLSIFHGSKIPGRIQEAILTAGSPNQKRQLLIHPAVQPEFRPHLAEALLIEPERESVATAFIHGDFPPERVAELLYSPDVRVAAYAADRLAQVASRVRLRAFTRQTFGAPRAEVNAFLADTISRGLPLGWYVLACWLLRQILAREPARMFEALRWIAAQPDVAGLHDLATCTPEELSQFATILARVPAPARSRIVLRSLLDRHCFGDLVRQLTRLEQQRVSDVLLHLRWRRIYDLPTLHSELRWRIDLAGTKNIRRMPARRDSWRWLSRLDGQRLSSGEKIMVPRTSNMVYRWSFSLNNCLARFSYARQVATGTSVLLGITRRQGVVYVIDLHPDTAAIKEAKGRNNTPVPTELVEEIRRLVADARAQVGLP